MAKNLLIVESPAKAKTIEKYLGKDFIVKSSYGHIRDLDKGEKGIQIDKNFEPHYVIQPDKKKVVSELRAATKKAQTVWLATDEDREGEAISWHLCKVLKLDENTTNRIVFREITKPAIQKAITNPRTVDLNLVDAQQARRLLDRLVGFELSELLWKKIKGKLSAGRVQSVAVKLIVEREREILDFEVENFYKIRAIFKVQNEHGAMAELQADLANRLPDLASAEAFLQKCVEAQYVIDDVKIKPIKRKPAAPFTTSTLQQEASRKLGFTVKRTMSVAQRLYEAGHITYMRTDSIHLSQTALNAIEKEVKGEYGDEYYQFRTFKTKKKDAQEAHEAIRPTYFQKRNVSGDRDQQRLYDLIWKRTMASQMADAIIEKTTVEIGISTIPDAMLQAKGEVIKFDGFIKAYLEGKDDDDDEDVKGLLPPLKKGQELQLDYMTGSEGFTRPPARYTEASLVKRLEELGIGRPSTYAPTISKIMEEGRGYVTKESREGVERSFNVMTLKDGSIEKKKETEITGSTSNRLYSSDLGMVVTDFLDEHFKEIMEYGFTAEIEEKFDKISDGKLKWREMLSDFYFPFHKVVEKTKEEADRASGERILGKDPKSGRTVLTRITRYGTVVQIGKPDELEEDEKPKYANLQHSQSIETIELDDALELFKLPRDLGEYEGEPVETNVGRYGPYVKHGKKFISLPKGSEPLEISREEAIEAIVKKQKEDAPIGYFREKPISKGKGRFGPFVKWDGMFVNISRKIDPETVDEEKAIELIEAKLKKEAERYIHQWPEEKISVENGRWGPFIKFKKKNVKLPKDKEGNKMTKEAAAELTLDDVKKIIETELPGSFKKKKAAKKKTTKKKATKKK